MTTHSTPESRPDPLARYSANFCATCGDLVYRDEMVRCEGCDKAPTFCVCVQRRREQQKRRMLRLRSRATAR